MQPDPDPHSEKLLDPDPQKMKADPQPWSAQAVISESPLSFSF